MTILEKQIDLLVRYTTTDDEELKKQLREELTATLQETREEDPAVYSNKLSDAIDELLDELGAPHNLIGRKHLHKAIRMAVTDEECLTQITSVLYPAIAKEANTTPSRVERAIRHAIETAWDRGDYRTLKNYFGNTIDRDKAKPTNHHFIAGCANIVRRQMRGAV
ncbi:MAG: hypothetical protein J6Q60_05745 [Bacteroidaceae bacterium]|nr:hypothetical protein [Bacteroidaceae bacterium]